jgi:hypothetical protein
MDEDMEHGQRHGNMDEDMKTWTRTWRHGRGRPTWRHDDIGTCRHRHGDMKTLTPGHMETWGWN